MTRRRDLRINRPLWRHHPAVRSGTDLTMGERAADRLRNGMGSWGFVFGALVFLAGWMLGNRNVGFDKYPFILLNLILSCLAALQGAILLIAARRGPDQQRTRSPRLRDEPGGRCDRQGDPRSDARDPPPRGDRRSLIRSGLGGPGVVVAATARPGSARPARAGRRFPVGSRFAITDTISPPTRRSDA